MNLEKISIENNIDNSSEYSDEELSSTNDIDDVEDAEDTEDEEDQENDCNSEIKKKKGRKSKLVDDIEKIQKKRGRKPKVKDPDYNGDSEKIPKKRGRKPKEKIYSVKELPKTFFEDNKNETFILHLPIKTSEDKEQYIPIPNHNDNYSYYNNDDNMLLTQVDLLDTKPLEYAYDINLLSTDKNISYINNKEDEMKTNKIIKKNLKNILYEFINANNDKVWPEKTDIHCWWCCHQFTSIPCAMPEYYKKEKFYVSGCFCSFNCTASYNFSKNDDNMWERYSLLNLMYKKLYNNNKFIKINLAPPREVLKIFGGFMSIEEFRENSLKNEKTFHVIKPPLISIIPKIEENISNSSKNSKNPFPIINENILNKTQNNLKLKRNKPITNPNNTLQSFMDLKII
jgi:hypothetical protein